MSGAMHELYLVCTPGLESLLGAEARAIGLRVRAIEPGGVTVDGTLADVVRANIWLRTANRVLVRVATFKATAFHELERSARRISWERFIGETPVRIRATCRKSKLYHSDAVAERVLGAIERATGTGEVGAPPQSMSDERDARDERVRGAKPPKGKKSAKTGSSAFIPAAKTGAARSAGAKVATMRLANAKLAAAKAAVAAEENARVATANAANASASAPEPGDDGPDEGAGAQLVVVRVFRDECTISIDSSGALLHRRGYRQATAKAPLRETLAAAMLLAAEWKGDTPVVDPLCGAGTIPIEAALIARRIAPGRGRAERAELAIADWPELPDGELARQVSAAREQELARAAAPIVGSDRDAGAIEAARANAERAGVAADVELVQRSLSASGPPSEARGLFVANPPYGVRLSEGADVRNIYAQLGKVAHLSFPGWRVGVLSPDRALETQTRLALRSAFDTLNGGIRVRYLVGASPEIR